MTSDYPRHSRARIEVELASGACVTEEVAHALGDPQQPLSDAQRRQKLRVLLQAGTVRPDEGLLAELGNIASGATNLAHLLDRILPGSRLKTSGMR